MVGGELPHLAELLHVAALALAVFPHLAALPQTAPPHCQKSLLVLLPVLLRCALRASLAAVDNVAVAIELLLLRVPQMLQLITLLALPLPLRCCRCR